MLKSARGTIRPLSMAMAAAVVACGAAAGDWNTGVGGNAARNSRSDETGPAEPTILWQGSRAAIVAQQAVTEGDLVVMPRIRNFDIPTGTWIVAQDLFTGAERWAIQLPCEFKDCWRSRVSAIRDGQVYATRAGNTNLEFLYALDPADGSIIWRSEDLVDEATTESLAFTDNGDIIAGNFNSLMRISRIDGTTMWTSPRTCPTTNGCEAAIFGDRAYIFEAGAQGPKISAFDTETGNLLYSSDGIGGGFVQQVGPLVGPDGTVYAPRTQNNPNTDFFVAFEDTGTALVEKWRMPLGYVPFASFGVGPDGSVYTYQTPSNSELKILRLNPADGSIVNESAIIPINFPTQPRIAIDSDGIVFLTNGAFSLGRLYSFNPDLTERWSVEVRNVNVGGPAIGQDGVLIVCGVGQDVRAYFTPAGQTAELVNLTMVTGAILSGGIDDLRKSDDARLRTRSGFGDAIADLHKMEMIVHAVTTVDSPALLDLTVEARIDEPSGVARLLLFNWNTNELDQVAQYAIGMTEETFTIEDIDAAEYINESGEIDLMVKHNVFRPFLAFTFESFVDWVEIRVEP